MNDIPEAEWKYLRTIKPEMLETLCKRINDEASQIITSLPLSQHEKFLHLFRHVIEKNEIIAECFDDWRRSNIMQKLLLLRQEGLLTNEHVAHLSEESQSKFEQI
jgi:hypothetical protein